MLIIFTVNDQKVTHDLGQRTLVAGSSGVVKAAFTFDNSWDGLDVVVVFSNSGKKCNNKPIKYDGAPIDIPPEVLIAGKLYVSVIGFGDSGTRKTTQKWDVQQAISVHPCGTLGSLDILRNMAQGSVPEENVATDEEVKQMLTEVFGSEEAPDEPDDETPVVDDEDVATVQQVQSEVAGSGHLSSEVVNTLPSPQEAKPNTIYFVLQNNAGAGNQYIEYILINGALEAIGYGNADLSGYVTEDYVAKADDSLMEDIFNQTSPIQEKYVGTGNLVAFWGLTKDLLNEMEAVQNDLASDIELLELCVTNRPVEGNPFVVTFETLNNLDVEGVWETANKRISF